MNQRKDVQALSADTYIEINYWGFVPGSLIILVLEDGNYVPQQSTFNTLLYKTDAPVWS